MHAGEQCVGKPDAIAHWLKAIQDPQGESRGLSLITCISCSGSMICARNCAQKWDGQSQLPLYDWVGIADIAASQIDDVCLSRSRCKQSEEQ